MEIAGFLPTLAPRHKKRSNYIHTQKHHKERGGWTKKILIVASHQATRAFAGRFLNVAKESETEKKNTKKNELSDRQINLSRQLAPARGAYWCMWLLGLLLCRFLCLYDSLPSYDVYHILTVYCCMYVATTAKHNPLFFCHRSNDGIGQTQPYYPCKPYICPVATTTTIIVIILLL